MVEWAVRPPTDIEEGIRWQQVRLQTQITVWMLERSERVRKCSNPHPFELLSIEFGAEVIAKKSQAAREDNLILFYALYGSLSKRLFRRRCYNEEIYYICNPKATLAQSVEQRIRNAQVASSSLVSGSKITSSSAFVSHLPCIRKRFLLWRQAQIPRARLSYR